MYRILIPVVVAIAWIVGISFAGTGNVGSARGRIMVVKVSTSDISSIQSWLDNRLNVEIVSVSYSGDGALIFYRQ